MSTIMVDATASERLTRQFEAVMRRSSPRDVQLEARRFVSYLCDRLERNNHALMAASRNRRADQIFSTAHASRQGESVLLTCQFLLNDLAARIGVARIADYLAATQTRAGRALAKRVGSRPNADLRIASIRFGSAETTLRTREFVAQPAPFAGTDTIAVTYKFRGNYPGTLRPALVIENTGCRSSHFAAAQVKLFAQFHESDPWTPTGADAFAFVEKVAPLEAQVLALRGFDIMDLLQRVDRQNRDPVSVRILARLI
ncbi:MAG: hypothetical protein IPK87_02205 [Planctomycetes bacterium]|nr:hypothetical protein [Planctomycetota bacterium]